MANKFHITKNGPKPCHASKRLCKYGEHFDSLNVANTAFEESVSSDSLFSVVTSSKSKGANDTSFPYLNNATRIRYKNKIGEYSRYYDNYVHDYDSYNADARFGEREFLRNYNPKEYTDANFSETADNIVLNINDNDDLCVLMIKRGGHPYKGCWAHPGGFIDSLRDDSGNVIRSETTQEAACRELKEETGMVLAPDDMNFVGHYDHDGRDPRMDVRMNTHVVIMDDIQSFSAGDDAAEAKFVPVNDLYSGKVKVAFDHLLSIRDALRFSKSNL